jgi:predicted dehydrogenase
MKNGKLTLGFIGLGYWGSNLLRVFNQLPGIKKIYVYDIAPERYERIKSQYSKVISLKSYDEIIEKKPNGVVIATPARTHYELTKFFLENKINVLVEKPLSLSIEDAEELIKIAENNKVKLMVDHTFIYNDAVRKVKELITNGELGDLLYVFSERLNLGKIRNDVNVWWNLAPHDVSIIYYLLEVSPVSIKANGMHYIQDNIEDVVICSLLFPNNVMGNIFVSWLHPQKVRRITVVGTKKMLIYDDVSTEAKITIYNKGYDKIFPKELSEFDGFGHFQLLQRNGDIIIPYFEYREPLKVMAQHFIECVTEDKEPLTGGKHALEVSKILCKADYLMKNGKN